MPIKNKKNKIFYKEVSIRYRALNAIFLSTTVSFAIFYVAFFIMELSWYNNMITIIVILGLIGYAITSIPLLFSNTKYMLKVDTERIRWTLNKHCTFLKLANIDRLIFYDVSREQISFLVGAEEWEIPIEFIDGDYRVNYFFKKLQVYPSIVYDSSEGWLEYCAPRSPLIKQTNENNLEIIFSKYDYPLFRQKLQINKLSGKLYLWEYMETQPIVLSLSEINNFHILNRGLNFWKLVFYTESKRYVLNTYLDARNCKHVISALIQQLSFFRGVVPNFVEISGGGAESGCRQTKPDSAKGDHHH